MRIPHDFRRTAVRNLERAGVFRSAAMVVVLVTATGGRAEFRLAPLDGSGVRVIPDLPKPIAAGSSATIDGFDWLPDGRRLAYVVAEIPPGVFVIEHPLADAPDPAAAARR